jgi:hypothetical protein
MKQSDKCRFWFCLKQGCLKRDSLVVGTEKTECCKLFLQSSELGPPSPSFGSGGDTLACGREGGCPNSDEGTDTVLYEYMYFVVVGICCMTCYIVMRKSCDILHPLHNDFSSYVFKKN